MQSFRRFRKDERGAVTVEWAVLTASVVFLAIGAINFAFKDAVHAVVDETAALVSQAME